MWGCGLQTAPLLKVFWKQDQTIQMETQFNIQTARRCCLLSQCQMKEDEQTAGGAFSCSTALLITILDKLFNLNMQGNLQLSKFEQQTSSLSSSVMG